MRMTKTIITAAATLALALSLTGCQMTGNAVQDGIDQAREQGFGTSDAAPDESSADTSALTATLIRVVDGDTITVTPSADFPATNDAGTEHTIRMLGIDTPELNKMSSDPAECGAEAASNHLEDLLSVNGASAQLSVTFDARADHVDRYGRSLAYIELAGSDINLAMVTDGFAEAWYPWGEPEPERFSDYDAAHSAAVQNNVGQHQFCDSIGR